MDQKFKCSLHAWLDETRILSSCSKSPFQSARSENAIFDRHDGHESQFPPRAVIKFDDGSHHIYLALKPTLLKMAPFTITNFQESTYIPIIRVLDHTVFARLIFWNYIWLSELSQRIFLLSCLLFSNNLTICNQILLQ